MEITSFDWFQGDYADEQIIKVALLLFYIKVWKVRQYPPATFTFYSYWLKNHVRSYEYRIDKFLQKKIVIFEIVSLKWEFPQEFQLSEGFYGFCVSVLICHIENLHTICILILACFWSTYFYKLYFLWRACIRNWVN